MAVIEIEIPVNEEDRVFDAVAQQYGWNAAVHGTKQAFTEDRLLDFLQQCVANNEEQQAAETARIVARQAPRVQLTKRGRP